MENTIPTRCGFVAVVGAPNAGKSTLVNALVGTKVSIVSPKVQTTRTRVLGIMMRGSSQIILVDTPGLFQPDKRNTLEKSMVAAAQDGLSDADLIVWVVDVNALKKQNIDPIIGLLKEAGKPCWLVLNKLDQVKAESLLKISADLNEKADFEKTFMISALKGSGVEDLAKELGTAIPEGPYHFPEDQVSDMPMRLLAAEITREKLFHKLHQELPYGLTVETESWEEFDNGSIKISQIIYLARDNHKPMILGKAGRLIKAVGEESRHELQDIIETEIHLKLFVKVRENWMQDPERYTQWGLDPNV